MATPIRKPHTSTADLLTWSEVPTVATNNANAARSHQPSDGIRKVVFGGQDTDEEAESLNKRKPCSGYKLKKITRSKIFSDEDEIESGDTNSILQTEQQYELISTKEKVSPKKPASLPEVAKQRELSGTLENDADAKTNKLLSDAKNKELCGNDIFGPPSEIPPRSLATTRTLEAKDNKDMVEPVPRNVRTSVKVSNVLRLLDNQSRAACEKHLQIINQKMVKCEVWIFGNQLKIETSLGTPMNDSED